MNVLKHTIKRIIRKLFPNLYLNLKAKYFDTSTIIYKKMTYQSILDQNIQDRRKKH